MSSWYLTALMPNVLNNSFQIPSVFLPYAISINASTLEEEPLLLHRLWVYLLETSSVSIRGSAEVKDVLWKAPSIHRKSVSLHAVILHRKTSPQAGGTTTLYDHNYWS